VGVLLLQHKYEAIRAHNHIYGIIKGSAVNHGGQTLAHYCPSLTGATRCHSRSLKRGRHQPRKFHQSQEYLPLISPLSQRGSGSGSVQRYGGAISVI